MKRGFFFSIDAILAATLLVAALLIITQYINLSTPQQETVRLSQDALQALSAIKVKEIPDPWVQDRITDGTIDDPDASIVLQLGRFWALNETTNAETLIGIVLTDILPPEYDLLVQVDEETFLNISSGTAEQVASARRMISGVSKGAAITGNSGVAFLQRITSKSTRTFTYFGGFVGQGDITTVLTLPSDVNASSIQEVWLEADIDQEFTLSFNGNQCGGLNNVTAGDNFTPDEWNFTGCKDDLGPGENLVEFTFADVNQAFIGGGFLRVTYVTDEFQQTGTAGQEFKPLPGIEGVVNLYDSFDINGELTGMEIYLHYLANHSVIENNTFYLTIGNETVYIDDNSTTIQQITLTNATLATLINYSELNRTTVPIRVGFQNLTFATDFFGAADVMIITDVSGSMNEEMGSGSTGTQRNCDDINLDSADTARLSVAKCLDKSFAQNILSVVGNLVGLISYSDSTDTSDTVSPTTNLTLINETVGNATPETGYSGGGATCICCGINSARDELLTGLTRNEHISAGASWQYEDSYLFSTPPQDASNRSWYELDYSLASAWSTGPALLGATNDYTYTPTVDTELAFDFGSDELYYVDFWEHNSDTAGAPADFSGGTLNQTANTFGLGAGDDGWDWDSEDNTGVFGYDDDADYAPISSGELEFDFQQSGDNSCSGWDCSAAFGISVTINNTHYTALNNGGSAIVQFDYEWYAAGGSNPFESSDEVWVKAYWHSPTSGINYLGSEQSSVDGDSTFEVDNRDNPDSDFSGTHTQDISTWIEGPGEYYFVLGGKLQASEDQEWGRFRFDNIQIEIDEPNPDILYLDVWEHEDDTRGAPADFSGGTLNQTANTFGLGAGDDGWDSDAENGAGPFGFDDDVDYYLSGGELMMDNQQGGDNSCSGWDCSGAFGIEVEITAEQLAVLQADGSATISFDYEWDDVSGNVFESEDQVWVKAVWESPTSGRHYLGSDLDATHEGGDADAEIATSDNPDADFSGSFSQDISDLIEGTGNYYLEIGGKLIASQDQEYGWWSFDNLQIAITNKTNTYYFRKEFTLAADEVGRGVLNVLADDDVSVFINGQNVTLDVPAAPAEYWDIRGAPIPSSNFVVGTNVVAVELRNAQRAAKFDLELATIDTDRDHAMMVMSDGIANRQCGEQGTGSSSGDAIQAACDAREDYGITVYSVGYSDESDDATLEAIAACGGGIFKQSSNTTELEEFYTDVAFSIISATIQSQTVVVQGAFQNSILFNDSYINYTYNPIVNEPSPGEIELVFQTDQFNSCNPTIEIFDGLRLGEAVVTSYSGEHWTDLVLANGNEAFNLSRFHSTYIGLGDPYRISIPVDYLSTGANNTLFIRTGDGPNNSTGCSDNNTLIYTAYVNSTTPRSSVLEFAEGCNWEIEFEDSSLITASIPANYNGTSNCSYTNASISYKQDDAYDDVVHRLFQSLDFDNDGRLFVNLDEEDLEVIVTIVSDVPYLWGPNIARVVVSR